MVEQSAKLQAELLGSNELQSARACICRAEIAKKNKGLKKRLLRQALAHLEAVTAILTESRLSPRDIGTKNCELQRLRELAIGKRKFSIPAPQLQSTSDPFPR
jgi:hypothetical protein